MIGADFSAFRCFARPERAGAEGLFDLVSQGYANTVLSRVLEGDLPTDIAQALGDWMGGLRPLALTWFASVAKMGRAVFEESQIKDELLGRLLLDLAPELGDFEYRFRCKSGLPIVRDGCLYHPSESISIASRVGETSVIGLGEGVALAQVGAITVVETRQSVESLCGDGVPALPLDPECSGNFGWAAEISEGLRQMARIDPAYDIWVRRVLKTLVVTERLPHRTCSGSWLDTSATVYMSQPGAPLDVGEVLIHECAHQHFHLASRVAPMKAPGESGRYFSPPVGRERPLDMILIAYHAFANVLTYYEKAFDMSLGDTVSRNRYASFREQVAALESHLLGNPGLSDLGRTIFEELYNARQHAGAMG